LIFVLGREDTLAEVVVEAKSEVALVVVRAAGTRVVDEVAAVGVVTVVREEVIEEWVEVIEAASLVKTRHRLNNDFGFWWDKLCTVSGYSLTAKSHQHASRLPHNVADPTLRPGLTTNVMNVFKLAI